MVPPMLVLGAGTPINGLTPALLSSVDPSGMVPESALGPTEDGGIAVPVAAEPTAVDAQPDVTPADPTPLSPIGGLATKSNIAKFTPQFHS